MNFPCEIRTLTHQPAVSVRFRAPVEELPRHFKRAYRMVGQYLAEMGVVHDGPVYAAYYNLDMQALDVEAGCALGKPLSGKEEVQASEVAGGPFAICHYTGPYDAMPPVYEMLMKFATEQGYRFNERLPYYEWYFNGPDDVAPKDLQTDIAIPLLPIEEPATFRHMKAVE